MIKILLSRKFGELRWTQADLARKTGIRPTTINELYHEFAERASLDHLDRICEVMDWYKIVEVEPAAGYTMKEPTEQIIYVEHDTAVEVTFENTPLNAIIVEKYDSVTGAALQGATFQLRYLGGTPGTGGTVIGQKVTDKNGIARETRTASGIEVTDAYAALARERIQQELSAVSA